MNIERLITKFYIKKNPLRKVIVILNAEPMRKNKLHILEQRGVFQKITTSRPMY
jgi:hypothetical protein